MGYPDKSQGYRFYCPSRGIKIVGSINAALFENGDDDGCSKIKDIVFKEERQASYSIILKRIDETSC